MKLEIFLGRKVKCLGRQALGRREVKGTQQTLDCVAKFQRRSEGEDIH